MSLVGSSTATPLPDFCSYEHGPSSLTSEQLSLGTGFNTAINAPLMVHYSPVTLAFEKRPQVWPLVAIGTGDAGTHAHVYADKFFCRNSFGQGHLHGYPTVPLAIFSEHFALLTHPGD